MRCLEVYCRYQLNKKNNKIIKKLTHNQPKISVQVVIVILFLFTNYMEKYILT